MLNLENKDVLKEFMKKVEATLGKESAEGNIEKTEQTRNGYKKKRRQLLERFLADKIAEDVYHEMDQQYVEKIRICDEKLKQYQNDLQNEEELKNRMERFRKVLSTQKILSEFDRNVFDSVIEKVLIGGYDEDGNKEPYKITFIWGTSLCMGKYIKYKTLIRYLVSEFYYLHINYENRGNV